ncbi:DUF3363 domain-containing protein [Acidithiobacillus caldus]
MSERRSDTSVSGKSFVRGKTIDDDERLRRPQAARVVRRVVAERRALPVGAAGKIAKAASAGGGKLFRPLPKGVPHSEAARRVTIKLGYVPNRKLGQWAAHGSYLERENAQQEGEKGLGFDAQGDEVSIKDRLQEWQLSGDPRLFKIVLSPEDGDRLNLRETTRETMARIAPHMAEDPTSVEWMAIDHYNTGHPHVHVLIRGRAGFRIPREIVKRGMRDVASEVATERLGYLSPAELVKRQEQQIEARRFTPLDREIERMAKPLPDGRAVLSEVVRRPRESGYAQQRIRMRRLEALERLGLAEKVGSSTWALDAGWTKALKELEIVRTRTKMVAESRALMTEPRCLPQVTKLAPGQRIVGRVLGTGLDERFDRSFVILEGTDYRAHIVYQTAGIEQARAAQELQLRHLVAIEGKSFEKDGRRIPYTAVEDYGLVIPDKPREIRIPEKALDDALDAGMTPQPEASTTGFQRFWHEQILERMRQREREKREREREEALRRDREREDVSPGVPEAYQPEASQPEATPKAPAENPVPTVPQRPERGGRAGPPRGPKPGKGRGDDLE